MFSLLVKEVMDSGKSLMIAPGTSVSAAARLMGKAKVGAALIVEKDRLQGIFTERDALFRVIAAGLSPEATSVGEVMTPDPITVGPDQSYGYALLMMFENGFRHAPVVQDGKPIGVVSSRNAMDPALEEFAAESSRREHLKSEKPAK